MSLMVIASHIPCGNLHHNSPVWICVMSEFEELEGCILSSIPEMYHIGVSTVSLCWRRMVGAALVWRKNVARC